MAGHISGQFPDAVSELGLSLLARLGQDDLFPVPFIPPNVKPQEVKPFVHMSYQGLLQRELQPPGGDPVHDEPGSGGH